MSLQENPNMENDDGARLFENNRRKFIESINLGEGINLSEKDLLPEEFVSIINSKRDIKSISDLIAVTKALIFPWNDTVSPNQKPKIIMKGKYPLVRDGVEFQYYKPSEFTFFSLNSHVKDHEYGNWKDCKYAILINLRDIPKEQIVWGNPVDFAVKGTIKCTRKYYIICPETDKKNFSNIMNNRNAVVISYKDIDLNSAINTVIAYLGFKLEFGYFGKNFYKLEGDDDIKKIAPILTQYGIEPHINDASNSNILPGNANFSDSIYAYEDTVKDEIRGIIAIIKQCKPSSINISQMLHSVRNHGQWYCYPCDKSHYINAIKSVLTESGYSIPETLFDLTSDNDTFSLDYGNEEAEERMDNIFLEYLGRRFKDYMEKEKGITTGNVYFHNFLYIFDQTLSIFAGPKWQSELRKKIIEFIFEREKEIEQTKNSIIK